MIYESISNLIKKAIEVELINEADRIYTRNQILMLLNLDTWPIEQRVNNNNMLQIPDILDQIVTYAIESEQIEDIFDDKEILKANIMNCFIPLPSTINKKFNDEYTHSPKAATDYFYQLSKNSNYIQLKEIAKNDHFKVKTEYGEIEITINLSKPEKDPEQIKRERQMKHKSKKYPPCLLCVENEGYEGRIGYPARANHRIIKIPLLHENWYFQYSPYTYYNEHSILLCEEHRDMKIDRSTFGRLLAFVEKFPHYFIGSNADLPIVGGSILSHDHYQAGYHTFAMDKAETLFAFPLKGHKGMTVSVLKWPLSVIRLQSKMKEDIIEASETILTAWKQFNDPDAGVIAYSGDIPHNTITPISRMRNGLFEMNLVLRNNRTTKQYPLGIFHPHPDVQHIKKENIGLIEVMGLAVLPARLMGELEEIKKHLLQKPSDVAPYHKKWVNEIQKKYGSFENVDQILKRELGLKFMRILEDAGVFKQDTKGLDAFKRFIQTINK